MRYPRGLILTIILALGAFVALLLLGFRSDHAAVASAPDQASQSSLAGIGLLSHPLQITCTPTTTTTDSLASANNYTATNAVALSNYTGLALTAGPILAPFTPQDDWFRLDNAKVRSTYVIEALPDKTTNYNLGMIVYYSNGLVEVLRNTDPADNHFANITFKPSNFGPYFFRIYQLTPQCTGETYRLIVSITTPTATPQAGEDPYEPNDSQATAYFLPVATSASAVDANFYPPGDEDWFAFYVKTVACIEPPPATCSVWTHFWRCSTGTARDWAATTTAAVDSRVGLNGRPPMTAITTCV